MKKRILTRWTTKTIGSLLANIPDAGGQFSDLAGQDLLLPCLVIIEQDPPAGAKVLWLEGQENHVPEPQEYKSLREALASYALDKSMIDAALGSKIAGRTRLEIDQQLSAWLSDFKRLAPEAVNSLAP